MQLGKELATGFVRDGAQATTEGTPSLPPEEAGTTAKAPQAAPLPDPEPEPAAMS
jgi:hypothetical protein